MALKPQSDKTPPPPPDLLIWGELADPGRPASVIRFECGDAAYSYPYHTLTRWVLKHGATDEISIQAGTETVIVHGRVLAPVQDALDNGRLRVLRQMDVRYAASAGGTTITDITVGSRSGTV